MLNGKQNGVKLSGEEVNIIAEIFASSAFSATSESKRTIADIYYIIDLLSFNLGSKKVNPEKTNGVTISNDEVNAIIEILTSCAINLTNELRCTMEDIYCILDLVKQKVLVLNAEAFFERVFNNEYYNERKRVELKEKLFGSTFKY